jgi:hypothetical protein
MEHECGSPAFDNIDDVLANRIVNHSRTHSDRTEPSPDVQPDAASPTSRATSESGHSGSYAKLFLLTGVILLVLLILLNRQFTRSSQR